MALFISFEGVEGAGKTTQADILQNRLVSAGFDVVPIREPGTTPMGNYIRRWLKGEYGADESLSAGAELFLFAAARADLVAKVIEPAIGQQGRIVIADRYADSSLAYQGYGRGLPLDLVKAVNTLATDGFSPDLTFLLDCPPEEGLKRIGYFQLRLPLDPVEAPVTKRRDSEGVRFEEESLDFHQRVHDGYRELARQESKRWRVIDATRSFEEVSEEIWGHVRESLDVDIGEGSAFRFDNASPDQAQPPKAGEGQTNANAFPLPRGNGPA